MLRACKDSDVTDKESCTRRTNSFSENPRMARDTQGQCEHKDLFSAKLQEIDSEIDMFEGRKRGLNTADNELQSNMPRNPPLATWGFSNSEGKAAGAEDCQELPKHVGLDDTSVKLNGPCTIGLSLGNTVLTHKRLDKSTDQGLITKPIYLKASQEAQGRKWTKLERLAPIIIPQNISPPLTRERPPPEASDTQPVKRKEVSKNESPVLSVLSAVVVNQPCRSP